jgi:hypothetical protein
VWLPHQHEKDAAKTRIVEIEQCLDLFDAQRRGCRGMELDGSKRALHTW